MLPPGIRLIDFPDYSKIVSGTKAPISFLKENFKVLKKKSCGRLIAFPAIVFWQCRRGQVWFIMFSLINHEFHF